MKSLISQHVTASRFARRFFNTGVIATIGFLFSAMAIAGPTKNYGTHWASVNDWGGGVFGVNWGTGSTANMTVTWNYPNGDTIWGYPSINRGWHYGGNPTGDTLFPKQISTISSAPCYFSYSAGGTNLKGDFAYDLFLRWDNAKSTPHTEIMIWGAHNSWPLGAISKSKALTVNGVTYDLWEGYNSSAGYYVYSFVPTNTVGVVTVMPTSGNLNIDLKTFFNYLSANRTGSNYSNSMYLDVVEAGIEPIRGGNAWAWIQGSFNAY